MPAPGALPSAWALVIEAALVATMLLVAARRKRLVCLFTTNRGVSWLGSLFMTTSGFFVVTHGPMGGQVSLYTAITWNMAWTRLPQLIAAGWPMLLGCVLLPLTYFCACFPSTRIERARWLVTGLFLAVVASIMIISWLSFRGLTWPTKLHEAILIMCPSVALLVLVVLAASSSADYARSCRTQLLGGAWVLLTLFPVHPSVSLAVLVRAYGIGYWMLLLGSILVTSGSVCALVRTSGRQPGHCQRCGYDLTGLSEARCPECGKPYS